MINLMFLNQNFGLTKSSVLTVHSSYDNTNVSGQNFVFRIQEDYLENLF